MKWPEITEHAKQLNVPSERLANDEYDRQVKNICSESRSYAYDPCNVSGH